jgi:phage-related protein
MSVNIDSLDIEIKTSAGQATDNIEKLADALEKLRESSKLGSVVKNLDRLKAALDNLHGASGALSKLPSKMNTATAATKRFADSSEEVKRGFDLSSVSLMAFTSNVGLMVQGMSQVVRVVSQFVAQAVEWDGIQFRFGRAFGEDAEETYAYIQKINDALGINIQQFMQYSSLYGSLLSGFGMAQEKVTTISVGLTELSYDIWAAYNDRFKTLEDASEAVRSAITGEIEPIRNAGIALTEASLQEYIDSTHLAGVSIEKLTEAQKSEVRYAAMVNAAMNQGIVGTYAREMNTAEGAIRSLTQSFKGLVQAIGSLFIPILQLVVPYVTAFVELITEAVFWVAKLFGIPIQEISWGNAVSGVGGVADGAKDATDGLNAASKAAKKLKDYTMGFDELNVISPDTGASNVGGAGAAGGSGWGEGLDLKTLWDDSVFAEASKKVDEIKAKIKGFFDEWGWLIALIGAGLTALMIHKAWPTILGWAGKVSGAFRGIITAANEIGLALKGAQFAPKFAGLNKIVTGFKMAATAVGTFVGGLTGPAILAIVAAIAAVASVAYFLYENWEKVVEAVKNFLKVNIAPKLEEIRGHISDLLDALGPVGDAIRGAYDWIVKFISGIDWSEFEWIGQIFETIGGIIFTVVGGTILATLSSLIGAIENVIQIFTGFYQVVSGVIKLIVAVFKGDFASIEGIVDLITTGVANMFSGMAGLITGTIVNFVGALIDWFNSMSEAIFGKTVPEMIDGIVEWFLSLPDKILGPIEEFTKDVLKKFQDLWSDTKTWWSEHVAPKFTLEYWKKVFSVISDAIATKLEEAKKKASEKWGEIKTWFDQNVAPKFTKSYWTEKFSGFKDGFETVIKNAMNAGIDKINSFISRANEALKFEWDAFSFLGKEIFPSGSFTLATIPTISRFENGGFIEDGLFTMNRGEIAGKFNNGKSVVANNEQIIAGISEGVYTAVVAAMAESQGGGERPVVVYLDGKQIYSSMKRTESRRGLDLMGNQLGYVY